MHNWDSETYSILDFLKAGFHSLSISLSGRFYWVCCYFNIVTLLHGRIYWFWFSCQCMKFCLCWGPNWLLSQLPCFSFFQCGLKSRIEESLLSWTWSPTIMAKIFLLLLCISVLPASTPTINHMTHKIQLK